MCQKSKNFIVKEIVLELIFLWLKHFVNVSPVEGVAENDIEMNRPSID